MEAYITQGAGMAAGAQGGGGYTPSPKKYSYTQTFTQSAKVAAKTGVKVEQYALRAAEDGFYPVMKRGFANPQELTWLNKREVWKFGTTKNPLTRYSQSYLDNIGEYGVYYSKEFSGTLQQSLQLEQMKIMNFMEQYGFKPAGNKMIK